MLLDTLFLIVDSYSNKLLIIKNMYKKSNFKAKSLSPILERLTPLLIIAATFVWLWK